MLIFSDKAIRFISTCIVFRAFLFDGVQALCVQQF